MWRVNPTQAGVLTAGRSRPAPPAPPVHRPPCAAHRAVFPRSAPAAPPNARPRLPPPQTRPCPPLRPPAGETPRRPRKPQRFPPEPAAAPAPEAPPPAAAHRPCTAAPARSARKKHTAVRTAARALRPPGAPRRGTPLRVRAARQTRLPNPTFTVGFHALLRRSVPRGRGYQIPVSLLLATAAPSRVNFRQIRGPGDCA